MRPVYSLRVCVMAFAGVRKIADIHAAIRPYARLTPTNQGSVARMTSGACEAYPLPLRVSTSMFTRRP